LWSEFLPQYLNEKHNTVSSCPAPKVQHFNPPFPAGGEASCPAPKVQHFNSPFLAGGEASCHDEKMLDKGGSEIIYYPLA